ncbi:MAG: serine hydrolase [Candidatus Magnetoovum sp. WYHC-5]|nr:serine hydrolase [Candidatus Magnetoovum sp. WYHC-5]
MVLSSKKNINIKYVLIKTFILCTAVLVPLSVFAYGLTARSAVILDGKNNMILYAKNPQQKQPPASTTKLVTAMVVLDNLEPDEVVTVSSTASNTMYTRHILKTGEQYTVEDLLHLLLMRSVNGAGVALAEKVSGSERKFVTLMNKKAAGIGAINTRYINSNGLPGEGQYITAYDLAKIMRKALNYPLIREIINKKSMTVTSLGGKEVYMENTNKLLWEDEDLLGGKTGFTNAARHCLAFAAKKGDSTYVAAVLGDVSRASLWTSAQEVLSQGQQIDMANTSPVIYEDGDNAYVEDKKVRSFTSKRRSSIKTTDKEIVAKEIIDNGESDDGKDEKAPTIKVASIPQNVYTLKSKRQLKEQSKTQLKEQTNGYTSEENKKIEYRTSATYLQKLRRFKQNSGLSANINKKVEIANAKVNENKKGTEVKTIAIKAKQIENVSAGAVVKGAKGISLVSNKSVPAIKKKDTAIVNDKNDKKEVSTPSTTTASVKIKVLAKKTQSETASATKVVKNVTTLKTVDSKSSVDSKKTKIAVAKKK